MVGLQLGLAGHIKEAVVVVGVGAEAKPVHRRIAWIGLGGAHQGLPILEGAEARLDGPRALGVTNKNGGTPGACARAWTQTNRRWLQPDRR